MHLKKDITACIIVILAILLSLARFIEFDHGVEPQNFSYANFQMELNPAQRLLLGEKIDINKANAEELKVLHRIGPKLAERIVSDRKRHGPFKNVDDMSRVYGIGKKIIEQNRHYICTCEAKN